MRAANNVLSDFTSTNVRKSTLHAPLQRSISNPEFHVIDDSSSANFQGERQPLEGMSETVTVTSCTSFDFDIHYFNLQSGQETREVKFSGQWDETQEGFVLTGPILQGLL